MRISTSSAILHPNTLHSDNVQIHRIPEILKEAGFESIDWSLWEFCLRDSKQFEGPLTENNWLSAVSGLREAADKAGLPCGQTHCVSVNNRAFFQLDHELLREMERRCVFSSSILGASWMVIHPFAPEDMDSEEAIRYYAEYLKPIQDWAHSNNIGIAIENMIARSNQPRRFCSTAEELYELVHFINDPLVGCCWDTGHANISGCDQHDGILCLGDHLKALHIDDNFGTNMDLHLLPFEGRIHWKKVMSALKKIRYCNDFAFEHALNETPIDVMPKQLAYMCSLGRYLVDMYE